MRRGCRLTTRTSAKGIAHWVDPNLLTWQSQATQRNTEKEIGVLTLQSQAPQRVTSPERIDFRYSLISSIHSDFGTIVEGINKPIQRNIIQLELFSRC
jgi:hypothetical protein